MWSLEVTLVVDVLVNVVAVILPWVFTLFEVSGYWWMLKYWLYVWVNGVRAMIDWCETSGKSEGGAIVSWSILELKNHNCYFSVNKEIVRWFVVGNWWFDW